ncbi:MAG: SDR family oxidoreductase [Nitrososphaeraceae archaeon]|nr:SDR family oxidoreductase [Nitrososphaeraceae archaeon]
MSKTILITGTSSGIGKATAKYFANKGWNVAATMRTIKKGKDLENIPNIKIFQLDVINEDSIKQAVIDVVNEFGVVDVVLNNAGYGLMGPFEALSKDQIQREFQTNLFGVMNITREILPHFKKNKNGLFINLTSVGGLVTLPYLSLYHSTKFALEGFSESIAFELEQFGIRVKIIEPGAVKTNFGSAMELAKNDTMTDYDSEIKNMQENIKSFMSSENASTPEMIAETIFSAAIDESGRLRYLSGKDAEQIYSVKREKGDAAVMKMMKQTLLGKE